MLVSLHIPNTVAYQYSSNMPPPRYVSTPTTPPLLMVVKEELLDPDDSELRLDDALMSQPSPADSGPADAGNALTPSETVLLELLKSLDMESLFPVFKDEGIYSSHLAKMTSPMILELLRPHCRIRTIVEFVNRLHQWKKHFGRKDVACNTDPKPTPTVPSLKQIIGTPKMSQLTSTSRNWLVEAITSYFVTKKLDFTQAIRDGITKQIVRLFPEESRWYYSDDGLAHRGADRLYVTFRYKLLLQNTTAQKPTDSIPSLNVHPRSRAAISGLLTYSVAPDRPIATAAVTPPVKVVLSAPTAMPPPAAVSIVPRKGLTDALKQPAPKTIKQMVQWRRASIAEERPRPRAQTQQTTLAGEKTVQRVTTGSNRYYVLHSIQAQADVTNTSVSAPSGGPPPIKVARVEPAVDHKEGPPEETVKEQDENSAPPPQPVDRESGNGGGQEAAKEDAESIKEEFIKSLTSCLELNKNILTRGFEGKLKIVNRFRDRAYCEEFLEKFRGLLGNSKRFNIGGRTAFQDISLSRRMTLALFFLPAVLNPNQRMHFSGESVNSFISVSLSVQEFVSRLRKSESSVPHVAIIGRMEAPLSYVVYYRRKVYRCAQLWHAVDMAVKIFRVFRPQIAADCANAWQFVMLHFYDMKGEGQFVYPSVRTLQGFFSLD